MIKSRDVRSVAGFRMGMSRYLAVGGTNSAVWRLDGDSAPSRLITSVEPVLAWLAVPLNTYRHDVLLLAETRNGVSMMTPDGFSEFHTVGDLNMFCQSNNGEFLLSLRLSTQVAVERLF